MIVLLWILAGLAVAVGIVGTLVPVVPGTSMVFGGLLLAAWIDDFHRVGWVTIAVLGLLTLVSIGVDLLAASLGARRVGASGRAVAGAGAGTLLGLFLGLPGLLVGPFLGAVAGEYLSRRDWRQAGVVGFGAWLGLVAGVAAKLGLAFAMLGIFLTAFLF